MSTPCETGLDRRPGQARISFLAIGLVALFLGGCELFGSGSDDPMEELRDQIRSSVSDADRSRAMLESVDDIDALLVESAAVMRDAASRERILFLHYDSTREDYAALFSEAREQRMELQKKLLAAHLDFKSHATAEEWETLSPAQANAVSSRLAGLLGEALERG